MNNMDIFLYESAVLVLAVALLYMGLALKNLTKVVKEKRIIWIFPLVSVVILLCSLALHAYAGFVLIPGLEELIQSLSSDEVIFDSQKLENIRLEISEGKETILKIKAVSFSCFFLAALFLLIPNWIYMKMISR